MATIRGDWVVGIFDSPDHAYAVITSLLQEGFNQEELGMLARHGKYIDPVPVEVEPHAEHQSTAAAGAEFGAVTGASLGVLGVLTVGATVAIPAVGPVIAGGVLAALVAGAAGGVAGGLIGGMVGLGVGEHEAHYYHDALRAGRAIVTVHTATRQQDAAELLNRFGAENMDPGTNPENGQPFPHLHLDPHVGPAVGGFTASGGLAEKMSEHEPFHLPQEDMPEAANVNKPR